MRSPVPGRTVLAVGERALLVECRDLTEVLSLRAALEAHPLDGQVEVQAGAVTLLVTTTSAEAARRLVPLLAGKDVARTSTPSGRVVTIDVVYDGDDLAAVAEMTGLSGEGVVRAHTGREWLAAFAGFAPGFLYLTAPDDVLTVPRRPSPRTVVPPGSVALAGGFSAVYPRASPGGWQLIGHTEALLWDVARAAPSLLVPGDGVRFVPVRAAATLGRSPATGAGATAPAASPPGAVSPHSGHPHSGLPHSGLPDAEPPNGELPNGELPNGELPNGGLLVEATGAMSLLEDLGRPGRRSLGVTPSGAADRGAAARANRLVGNDRRAAVVETVLGGLRLRAVGDQVVAVTGAPAPVTVGAPGGEDTSQHRTEEALVLRHGQTLEIGQPSTSLRSYVAVRGGLDVAPVLGSRSTDVLSGTGPPPLAPGQLLPVGTQPGAAVGRDEAAPARPSGTTTVRVVLGPRDDWFTGGSVRALVDQEWVVTDQSNRVGLRLAGDPLVRQDDRELPSEGTVAGAVQVPASGLPVVLLADHPVSGGYPVVAVVREADLDLLAQLRPGDLLRFVDD